MNVEYDKVCRTCLGKSDELFYIYDKSKDDVAVAEMIMTCTSVVVCWIR